MSRALIRARSAVAIGVIAVALTGCAIPAAPPNEPTPTAVVADVFSIATRDCFNAPIDDGKTSTVAVIDCTAAHDFEAYQSVILPEGDFSGDVETEASAEEKCIAAFEAFVGVPYAESELLVNYFYPSEETWADGDREVVCVVQDANADGSARQATGTLADAAR